jgi:hypothetical protein
VGEDMGPRRLVLALIGAVSLLGAILIVLILGFITLVGSQKGGGYLNIIIYLCIMILLPFIGWKVFRWGMSPRPG